VLAVHPADALPDGVMRCPYCQPRTQEWVREESFPFVDDLLFRQMFTSAFQPSRPYPAERTKLFAGTARAE